MSDASRAKPEDLLGEARWVHELARTLAIDRFAADDLVQETWLAALRHAPKQLISPRAWLARVLLNAARHDSRRSSLRAERELGAARPEALPSTARIAERAEMQRLLVGAVLALEEPYRSTILWRYFEGWKSEEIAGRLGLSASTVRNRLRRGLDHLRAALERHDASNWQDRCLALATFGFGGREAGAGVASKWIVGGVVKGIKAKVTLGIVASLAVSAVLWRESSRQESSGLATSSMATGPTRVIENEVAPGSPSELAATSSRTSERQTIEPDATTGLANTAAAAVVFGDVRFPAGFAPASGRVEMRDEWGASADTPIVRSAYAIPGLHAGRWILAVRDCAGFVASPQKLELAAGASLRADIELRRAHCIAIRVRTTSGETVESFFRDDQYKGTYQPRVEVLATREPLAANASAAELARLSCGIYTPANRAGQAGRPQVPEGFSGVLELEPPFPAYASAMLRGHVASSARIESDTSELELIVDPDRMLAALGTLRLRLLAGNTREPIEHAGISLTERSSSEWANPIQMNLVDGSFERHRLPSGTYEMQFRVPGFEHLVRTVTIESGRTMDLGDIYLSHGGAVRGRVVDESGRGVSVPIGWSSTGAPEGPTFIETTRSASDGLFVLAELPVGDVLVRITDPEWALDPASIHLQPGAHGEIALTARRGTRVTLRQRLAGDVKLVLRTAGGGSIWSARELGPSTHPLRLVSGSYEVEARSDARPSVRRAFVVADEPIHVDLEP